MEIGLSIISLIIALYAIWISFKFQSQASKINQETMSLLEVIKQSSKTVEEKTFRELEKYGDVARAVISGKEEGLQVLATSKDIASVTWAKEVADADKGSLDLIEDIRRRTYEEHLSTDELTRNKIILGIKVKMSDQGRNIVLEVLRNPGISVKHLMTMKYKLLDIAWMIGYLEVLGVIKYLAPLNISNFTDLRLYISPVVKELFADNK